MAYSFLEVFGLTIVVSSYLTPLRSIPILVGTFPALATGATTLTLVGSEAGNYGLAKVSESAFFPALLLSVFTFSNSSSSSLLLNP